MIIGVFKLIRNSIVTDLHSKPLKILQISNSPPPKFIKHWSVFSNHRNLNSGRICNAGQRKHDLDVISNQIGIEGREEEEGEGLDTTNNNTDTKDSLNVTTNDIGTSKKEMESDKKKKSKRMKNLKKSEEKRIILENQKLAKYIDIESYLNHAKSTNSKITSTVFQGNLYELTILEFLRNKFDITKAIHQGGKNDKGIDIRANWDLTQLKAIPSELPKESSYELVNATKRLKPLIIRKNKIKSLNVKLFVQCKCYEKSRIDAKLIREINGTYSNTVSQNSNSRVFFMLVTPTTFTRQGRIDFDLSQIPLIFCKYSKSRKIKGDGYSLKDYDWGQFESFYCNPIAHALLKGIDWTKAVNETSDKIIDLSEN
ncbi:hypothetical protein B5S28_g3376 [[Candida] boidinii]|nr:hypothetical protein B5S28_g3376 [[Candida] boidinii]OWB71952.1 hypothetical protein B5S31_g1653 [[Candida] boidinii]